MFQFRRHRRRADPGGAFRPAIAQADHGAGQQPLAPLRRAAPGGERSRAYCTADRALSHLAGRGACARRRGKKSEIVAAAISLRRLDRHPPDHTRYSLALLVACGVLCRSADRGARRRGLLDEAVRYLNSISIPVGVGEGERRGASAFSALDLVRVIFIFAALFWISSLVSRFLKSQISAVDGSTPSLQALLISHPRRHSSGRRFFSRCRLSASTSRR